jgi:hypothetical protein
MLEPPADGSPEEFVRSMMAASGDRVLSVRCERESPTSFYCVAKLERGSTWEGRVFATSYTSDE